jgi:hypothetical protein
MDTSLGATPSGPRRGWRRRRRGVSEGAVHYVDQTRRWANVSLVAVTGLLLLAAVGPWWQIYVNAASGVSGVPNPAQQVTVSFLLDGTVTCSSFNHLVTHFEPCGNLTGQTGGARGVAATALGAVALGGVAAGVLGCALATLGNLGIRYGRRQLDLEIALAAVMFVVAIALVVGFTSLGPGPLATSDCREISGNYTGCPLLWGGSTGVDLPGICGGCANTMGWATGTAWYGTIVAAAIAGVTARYLWSGRQRPYTHEEEEAWGVRHVVPAARSTPGASAEPSFSAPSARPPGPETVWARPPTEATHPGFRIAEAPWTCPACGSDNSRWAVVCSRCHADRPRA